jgi:hypothetical protein
VAADNPGSEHQMQSFLTREELGTPTASICDRFPDDEPDDDVSLYQQSRLPIQLLAKGSMSVTMVHIKLSAPITRDMTARNSCTCLGSVSSAARQTRCPAFFAKEAMTRC